MYDADKKASVRAARRIYRHRLPIRLTHWIAFFCVAVLLTSGLQIFNAHPALYWGDISDFDDPLLVIGPTTNAAGAKVGAVRIFDRYMFETTGVLGLTGEGAKAFPGWATLPSPRWLAMGRHWHFFFAWALVLNLTVYVVWSLASRHLQRGLVPTRYQLLHIGRSLRDHLLLRWPEGEEARHYNVLQKLSYLLAIFGLLPLIVFTGLSMSPHVNAAAPWMPELFGGRQSARTVHFLAATGLVVFVLVHLAAVLASGAWNNIRSMFTGRYLIRESRRER